MKNCLLVAGGAVSASLLHKFFREGEFAYVFAVDRGLEALDACGIRPTHLIGDFDSVAPGVLEKYRERPVSQADGNTVAPGVLEKYLPESIEFERLIPEKDDTDTEHAMRRAVALNPDEIVLMGGFGTRFDHVLANVHTLLIPLRAGIPACMVDETNRVRLLGAPEKEFAEDGVHGSRHLERTAHGTEAELRIKKRDAWGKYVSLLPLTAEVSGITLSGFRYPLVNGTFKIGKTVSLGVSNELAAEEGVIRVQAGILVVVESSDG